MWVLSVEFEGIQTPNDIITTMSFLNTKEPAWWT